MVIGCSGSGKSTFSRSLAELSKLPLIHLDQVFWKPNWTESEDEEFRNKVEVLCLNESWIMDGNYSRTMDLRFARADTIIFLDRPTWLCFYRAVRRIIVLWGKSRQDITEGCNERFDHQFFGYILGYNKNRRPGILAKLEEFKTTKTIHILKSDNDILQFIEQLEHK